MKLNLRTSSPKKWEEGESDALELGLKPIPETNGYYINESGDVYSHKKGKLLKLKPYPHPRHGYVIVTITDAKGKRKTRGIHQLVARTYIGPCKLGEIVDHIDRDKHNNHVSNLRYASKQDNRLNSSNLNITDENFVKIRKDVEKGLKLKTIAEKYNVKVSTIRIICDEITFFGVSYPAIKILKTQTSKLK